MEFTQKLGEALLATCSENADTKTIGAATTAVAEMSKHEGFAAAAADLIRSNPDKPLAIAAVSALKNAAAAPHVRTWLKAHLFALLNHCGSSKVVKGALLECAAVVSAKAGWPELVKQLGDKLVESKGAIAEIASAMDVIRALHGDDGALASLAPALLAVFDKCVRSWSEAKEQKDSDAVAKILKDAVTTLIESEPLATYICEQEERRLGWTKMVSLALVHPKSKTDEAIQSLLWRALAAVGLLNQKQAELCLEHAVTTELAHADIMMWLVSFAPDQRAMFHYKAPETAASSDVKMESKKRKPESKKQQAGKRARMGLGGEKTVVEMDEDEDDGGDGEQGTRLLDLVFRRLIGPAMIAAPEEYALFRDDQDRFIELELNPSGLTEDTKRFVRGHPVGKRLAAQHLASVLFRDHSERMTQLIRRFVQKLCVDETMSVNFLLQEALCNLMTVVPEWNQMMAVFVEERIAPLIADRDVWGPSIERAFLLFRFLGLLIKYSDHSLVSDNFPLQLCADVTAVGDRPAAALFSILMRKWMPKLKTEAVVQIIGLCCDNIKDARQQNDHVAHLLFDALTAVDSSWFADQDDVNERVAILIQALNVVRVRQSDGAQIPMYPHWLTASLSVCMARGKTTFEKQVSELIFAVLNPASFEAYGVYAFHLAGVLACRVTPPTDGKVQDPMFADIFKGLVKIWYEPEYQPELRRAAFRLLAQFAKHLGAYLSRGEERLQLLSEVIVDRLSKTPKDPEATSLASLLVLHLPPSRLSKRMPEWLTAHVKSALESKQNEAVGNASTFALACLRRLGLASGDFPKLCGGLGQDMFRLIWTKMVVPCMKGDFRIDPQHAPLVAEALKHLTTEAEWKSAPDFVVATAETVKTALASAAPPVAADPLALPYAPSLF